MYTRVYATQGRPAVPAGYSGTALREETPSPLPVSEGEDALREVPKVPVEEEAPGAEEAIPATAPEAPGEAPSLPLGDLPGADLLLLACAAFVTQSERPDSELLLLLLVLLLLEG